MAEGVKSKNLLLRAASASVAVALLLVAVKGIAFWRSDSVALLGSLADSGLDFFTSLIGFCAIQAQLRHKAEKRRRHIRAEAMAGLVLIPLILAVAVYLGWRSFQQVMNPVVIEEGFLGVAVSVLAILLSLSLLAYQRHVVEKTGSKAVSADRIHFLADVMLNLWVIFALMLATGSNFYAADGIFGFGIAGYVALQALLIAKNSFDLLDGIKNEQ